MKKSVLFLISFVLVASLFGFVSAEENETNSTTSNSTVKIDPETFDDSFACLENTLKSDCSGASTIEELSLAVLASTSVSDKCLVRLKEKKTSSNCWGEGSKCSVKDTALAILALNHAGEKTDSSELWLLSKNLTSNDLIWYLQEDSKEKTECKISYNANNYNIQVYENKKISGAAGSCLSLATGSFWLQVNPTCYDRNFSVMCDKDFIATLLYQQKNSPTLYVLSDTAFSQKFGTITLSPRSFCFGDSGTCNYEASAWATLALLRTGHEIDNFIPYLVAMEETNEQYLPKAFSYIVTEQNEYAFQLIEQKGALNDYWQAEGSAKGKYYDSALAYLSISGISSEVDSKLREWFKFSRNSKGCWELNSKSVVRDTSMILWALEGKSFVGGSGEVLPTTRCTEAGFFCMTSSECVLGQDVSDNYFCESMTRDTCCTDSNLKSCTSELEGSVCREGFVCDGGSQDSKEGSCCLGECIEAPEETECESEGYFCKSSCSATQEEKSYYCGDSSLVCCGSSTKKSSGSAWIWILVVLILIVLGIIGWMYREKIKLWWFKLKTKFRKDKGKNGNSSSVGGLPPRPGFPPIRGPPMPPRRPAPSPVSQPVKGQLDEVFKKLHEMSK
jgi:hypothetical protein